ncbi:MAG: hypothetical protein U0572_00860 [Phycisphaerales bacterium]
MLLHGVDFSGAESGGSAKIRIVERNLRTPKEPVVSRGRADRGTLVRMIRESVRDERDHVWRIDAPFALPIESLDEIGVPHEWLAMAQWLRDFGSPRGWRHDMREVSRREPRRFCDRAEHTPMAPMNLRVFKQTWTLICEVLLPLAEDGVRIEPVANTGEPSKVVVCEGCPSSVLQRHGWPTRGYKGKGEPPKGVRAEIAAKLKSLGVIVSDALAKEAVADEEGDLLDAILLVTPPTLTVVPPEALVEAWVY